MSEVSFEPVEILSPNEAALVDFVNRDLLGYRIDGALEYIPEPSEDGKMLLDELALEPVVACLSAGSLLWDRVIKGIDKRFDSMTYFRYPAEEQQIERLRDFRALNAARLALAGSIIARLQPEEAESAT